MGLDIFCDCSAPKWYSQYRFYLSLLVGTCIIGSLAGTSYWGPVAGHGFLSHDLEMIREARRQFTSEKQGKVTGTVEAVVGAEDADHYVIIKEKSTNDTENDAEQDK